MLNIKMQSQDTRLRPKITVIGVGGAGGNAVNNMISSGLEGCEFLVCNTDAQALEGCIADQRIQLGPNVTRGLGAGANPEIGGAAAEETIEEILEHLEGSNMVFVTAGMGGGTGTGAAPVIARAARERGILTVGVVTKPFHFEGTHRMKLAENGIEDMQHYVDTLIVIPNQNLFRIANEKTTFADAFCMADEVLQSGVRGVTDLMIMPGLINLDFADIRSVMAEMGKAMMGTGEAEGERRAIEAAEAAISNPLLDDISMQGANGVLINITGGMDMTLFEVDEAANRIRDEVDQEANIIFGSTFDEKMEGRMRVSVVATGIEAELQKRAFNNDRAAKMQTFIKKPTEQVETQQAVSETTETVAETTATAAPTMSASHSPLSAAGQRPATPVSAGFRNDIPKMPSSIVPQSTPTHPVHAHASAKTEQTVAKSPATPAQPTTPAQPQTGHADVTSGQSYGQQAAAARKLEESEYDVSATQTQPLTTPVSQKRSLEQPKAQRYGNTFIPPKPVDPRLAEDVQEEMFTEETTTNTAVEAPVAKTEEPKLSAPQQPAAPQPEKQKPSFFERLTGQKKPEVSEEKPATAKKDSDDELDIPAFLRRQAN